MVDTSDSKSDVARRAGSSPAGGTTLLVGNYKNFYNNQK